MVVSHRESSISSNIRAIIEQLNLNPVERRRQRLIDSPTRRPIVRPVSLKLHPSQQTTTPATLQLAPRVTIGVYGLNRSAAPATTVTHHQPNAAALQQQQQNNNNNNNNNNKTNKLALQHQQRCLKNNINNNSNSNGINNKDNNQRLKTTTTTTTNPLLAADIRRGCSRPSSAIVNKRVEPRARQRIPPRLKPEEVAAQCKTVTSASVN